MLPLVTCIVPVWNGGPYLAAAIDSILAQDHHPLEVIVVDDGSTDGSPAVARSYGDRIRLIEQSNGGAPAARNAGIDEARGEFVTFLDSDDLYRPAKISAQLRFLTEHPEVDLCVCTARNFWEPGLEDEQARYEAAGRVLITHHFATLMTRRSTFERVGRLDESRPSGDYIEWFHRATDLGLAVSVMPDVLIDRRMHVASHSRVVSSGFDVVFELARARIELRRG
jgi:glycosyltransferase involved in cell wall biosynthesis